MRIIEFDAKIDIHVQFCSIISISMNIVKISHLLV